MNVWKHISRYQVFIWLAFAAWFGKHLASNFLNQGLDFDLYYAIGELFKAGQSEGIYVTWEQGPYYAYSPFVAPLFYYMTGLPQEVAKVSFVILRALCFALWPYILSELVSVEDRRKAFLASALACLALSPAIFEEGVAGNINLFILTAMFVMCWLFQNRKTFSGAFIAAVVVMFKPQYGLFCIPFLFQNFRQAVAGGAAGAVALVAHALVFFNVDALIASTKRWIELISVPIAGPEDANNMATNAIVHRLFREYKLSMAGDLPSIHLTVLPEDVVSTLVKALVVFFLGLGGVSFYRIVKKNFVGITEKSDSLFLFSGIAMLTVALAPVVWLTHHMLLVFPLVYLFTKLIVHNSKIAVMLALVTAGSLFSAGQLLNHNQELRIFARAFAWTQIASCLVFFYLCFESILAQRTVQPGVLK